MRSNREYLRALLAEKTYIEKRYAANLDLQHKAMALGFGLVITALGWVATKDLEATSIVIILLGVVSINAIAILMAVAYGGFALTALTIKAALSQRLQTILAFPQDENLFDTIQVSKKTPGRKAVLCATRFFTGSQALVTVAAYASAFLIFCNLDKADRDEFLWRIVGGLLLAGVLLAGAIVSLIVFVVAFMETEKGRTLP